MNEFTAMNPNPLVQYLNKPAAEFTRADLIRFIEDNDIEMINFRYTAWDGRLKTLNFIINNRDHLEALLSSGERVDGSSLFPFIEAGSSDLYVIPKYKTAFVNPFTEVPTLDVLCAFYDRHGKPFESSPEFILKKAHRNLKDATGLEFETMGELEYYVIAEEEALYPAVNQKGYHESSPFNKSGDYRREAMRLIAQSGGQIKYGHSEVGNFSLDGLNYEQNEVEFLPTNVEDAADQLVIAKWIMRKLAYRYGLTITFAPKITVGKAGSGMHVHTRLMKNGKSVMMQAGKLSDEARKAIAGYLSLAASLTAFGNAIPTSYFRLVPHQEAPTNICWGDRNRSVLVRVPLGWTTAKDMIADANPQEIPVKLDFSQKQTVEFRAPDGSADIYLLMAGLTVAAHHGLEMEDGLAFADKTYVDVNIFDEAHKAKQEQLEQLPTSCEESADALEKHQEMYKKNGVFPDNILQYIIKNLRSFKDKNLRQEIGEDTEKIMELVTKHFHCG
ncbi:MAG: glutamine synthetase family protein [Bacteroidetes bacterium]|jgi:glutamine synthetase|nr:glutamine synthetase family protein [Bacteroidota bacterium]MBU1577977.1 glutamine synthetase family protein [Bacteroidota bacterium]MBU2466119.1 glutamine synthetase family protein [Bacteroidota bacterium]MDA3942245.1 glutamine synthetase family protein [Bacteroidota bacterium]